MTIRIETNNQDTSLPAVQRDVKVYDSNGNEIPRIAYLNVSFEPDDCVRAEVGVHVSGMSISAEESMVYVDKDGNKYKMIQKAIEPWSQFIKRKGPLITDDDLIKRLDDIIYSGSSKPSEILVTQDEYHFIVRTFQSQAFTAFGVPCSTTAKYKGIPIKIDRNSLSNQITLKEHNNLIRRREKLEAKFKLNVERALDGDFKAASKLSGCAKRLIRVNLRLSNSELTQSHE